MKIPESDNYMDMADCISGRASTTAEESGPPLSAMSSSVMSSMLTKPFIPPRRPTW